MTTEMFFMIVGAATVAYKLAQFVFYLDPCAKVK